MTTDAGPVRLNGVLGLATRRWYLVLAGLLVTLPLAYLAAQHVTPTYTMRASVVLLPPAKAVGAGGNPYMAMGGLETAVDVSAAALSSDAVQQKLAASGATSGVVEPDGSTAAPILLVTVVGPTEAAVQDGLAVLVDEVPATLAKMQQAAGVSSQQEIRSEVVAASERPLVSHKPQLRAALMVLVAGAALTLMFTALTDNLLSRRRRRRGRPADGGEPRSGDEPPHLRVPPRIDVGSNDDGVSDLRTASSRKR
jgi:hypothetical protein